MLTPFAELARRVFALVPRPNFNQGRRSAYPRPFVPTASAVEWEALTQRTDFRVSGTLVIL